MFEHILLSDLPLDKNKNWKLWLWLEYFFKKLMENRNFLIDKVGCSWYPIKTSFLALVIALFYHFCFNFTLFVHTGHVKFDFNAIWKTLNSQQLRILALGIVIVWG